MVSISPQQVAVLQCLLSGASNKEIARKLAISDGTVKVHIRVLLSKLKLKNRTQAAVWAHAYFSQSNPAELTVHPREG
jgi:two-component system, NarL family, nitrate/nitrite response regulator NarL